MPQPTGKPSFDHPLEEHYRVTRDGVVERLSDPYLTEHDRWVQRQFAHFLGGQTPAPDPRVATRPPMPVPFTRVRRSSL